MTTCQNTGCTNAATRTVSYGCVHEHVVTNVNVCTRCVEALRRVVHRQDWVCEPCLEDDHWCPMALVQDVEIELHTTT